MIDSIQQFIPIKTTRSSNIDHDGISFSIGNKIQETQEHIFHEGSLENGHKPIIIKVYKEPEDGVTEDDVLCEYKSELEAIQVLDNLNLGPEFIGETNVNNRPALLTSNGYKKLSDLPHEEVLRLFTGESLRLIKESISSKAQKLTSSGYSIPSFELAITNNTNPPEIIFINPLKLKQLKEEDKIKETKRIIETGIDKIENALRSANTNNCSSSRSNNFLLLSSSPFGLTTFQTHTSPTKTRFEDKYIGKVELIERINHGNSSEVFHGDIVLSNGTVQPVAVKILHDKYISQHFGWEYCLSGFEQEERNARILEEHTNGAKVYGFVNAGGNPGLAFELIHGKHSKELSENDLKDLVTENTIRSAERCLQELASQGYRLDDIQFFIVDKDSETRKKGDFILTDPGQLTFISNPSESFNFMWNSVRGILKITAQ